MHACYFHKDYVNIGKALGQCRVSMELHGMPVWRNGRRTGLKIPGPLKDVSVRVRPPVPLFLLRQKECNYLSSIRKGFS